MRKLFIMLLFSTGMWAQTSPISGYCMNGNQSVQTQGMSSSTKVMRSYSQCTVTVYVHGLSSVNISSVARSGGTVTATFASSVAKATIGDSVVISGVTDTGFNGTFNIVTVSGSSITYIQAGSDTTSSGGAGQFIPTLYSDEISTPLTNPFTARVDGSWQFYHATPFDIDVTMSGDGISSPFTLSDIRDSVSNGGGNATQIQGKPIDTPNVVGSFPAYNGTSIPFIGPHELDPVLKGAKEDGIYLSSGCSSSIGFPTIICTGANWTSADNGKRFIFFTPTTNHAFVGTISNALGTAFTIQGGTAPSTNATGSVFYATDDTAALQSTIDLCGANIAGQTLKTCHVTFTGPILTTSTINIWNKSIEFSGKGYGSVLAGNGQAMGSLLIYGGSTTNAPILYIAGNIGSYFHDFHIMGNSGASPIAMQFQQNGGDSHNNQHNHVARMMLGPYFIGDPDMPVDLTTPGFAYAKNNIYAGINFIPPEANDDQMVFDALLITGTKYAVWDQSGQAGEHAFHGLWINESLVGFTCINNEHGSQWFFALNDKDIYVGDPADNVSQRTCNLGLSGFGSEGSNKFIYQGPAGSGSVNVHDSSWSTGYIGGVADQVWIDGRDGIGPLTISLENFGGLLLSPTASIKMRSNNYDSKNLLLKGRIQFAPMPSSNIDVDWRTPTTSDQTWFQLDLLTGGQPFQWYRTNMMILGGDADHHPEINHSDVLGQFDTFGNIRAKSIVPAASTCTSQGAGGATSYSYAVTSVVHGRESLASNSVTCAASNNFTNTIASDNFDRADGGLGANWTNLWNAPAIISNTVGYTLASYATAKWTGAGAFGADQWAQVTISNAQAANDGVGPACRLGADGTTGYGVSASTNSTSLRTLNNDTPAQIGLGVGVSDGDVIRLNCQGTTISVVKNGVTIISVTNATTASGAPGITMHGTASRLDNWSAGDFSAPDPSIYNVIRFFPQPGSQFYNLYRDSGAGLKLVIANSSAESHSGGELGGTIDFAFKDPLTLTETSAAPTVDNTGGLFADSLLSVAGGAALRTTNQTGTGNIVLATAPTISAPTVTGHPVIEGVTSTGATGTGKFVFDTSPTISGPTISGHPTIEGVTSTGATGNGKFVFDNTPAFTTPDIGAATTASQITSTLATGTAPFSIASTTPVANLTTVPVTYDISGTQQTGVHIVMGHCILGTSCSITLTGSAAFTSSSTYECSAVDETTAAAVKFAPSSGSAFALTGTGTDTLSFICIGN